MLRKLLVGGASKARADGEILMASLGWWVPIRKQGRGVELCRGNQRWALKWLQSVGGSFSVLDRVSVPVNWPFIPLTSMSFYWLLSAQCWFCVDLTSTSCSLGFWRQCCTRIINTPLHIPAWTGFYVLQIIVPKDKVAFTVGSSRKGGWNVIFSGSPFSWSALGCNWQKSTQQTNKKPNLLIHVTKKDQFQGRFALVAQMRSTRAEFLFTSTDFSLGISFILMLRVVPNPTSLPTHSSSPPSWLAK